MIYQAQVADYGPRLSGDVVWSAGFSRWNGGIFRGVGVFLSPPLYNVFTA